MHKGADDIAANTSRRSDILITILKVLVLLIALASLCLAFRPQDSVPDWPLTEDGYYAYTVSQNIAKGQGITIDGTTLTNGFQPLFTFISVPVFKLAGGIDIWPSDI